MHTSVSYSSARAQLKKICDSVCEQESPVIITRKAGEDVVILSYKHFSELEETSYLLRSPKNAQRILEAVSKNSSERTSYNSLKDALNEMGI
jgi:antitoxin YefM